MNSTNVITWALYDVNLQWQMTSLMSTLLQTACLTEQYLRQDDSMKDKTCVMSTLPVSQETHLNLYMCKDLKW